MLITGSGRKAHMVSFGTDAEHEDQRARGEHHGVGRVHDARADQHAHGVQVVGGARHDVAGTRALIEAVGEALQVREQVVAQVELNLARNADQDPAGQELEDRLGSGDGQQRSGIKQQLMKIVTCLFRSSMARRMTSGNRIHTPLLQSTQSAPIQKVFRYFRR